MRLKGIIRSIRPGKPLQAASDDIGAISSDRAEYEKWLESYVEMELAHGRKREADAVVAAMAYANDMCSEK